MTLRILLSIFLSYIAFNSYSAFAVIKKYNEHAVFKDGSILDVTFTFDSSTNVFSNISGQVVNQNPILNTTINSGSQLDKPTLSPNNSGKGIYETYKNTTINTIYLYNKDTIIAVYNLFDVSAAGILSLDTVYNASNLGYTVQFWNSSLKRYVQSDPTQTTLTVLPDSQPLPTVSINATPNPINSGSTTILNWQSTNATACVASDGWNGNQTTAGNFTTGILTTTKTYKLSCTGLGGSVSQSVTVNVNTPPPPTVSLSANPNQVNPGSTTTLNWSSTNANSCSASGGWSGGVKTVGSLSTSPLNEAKSFQITCIGNGGSVSQSVTVGVNSYTAPSTAINDLVTMSYGRLTKKKGVFILSLKVTNNSQKNINSPIYLSLNNINPAGLTPINTENQTNLILITNKALKSKKSVTKLISFNKTDPTSLSPADVIKQFNFNGVIFATTSNLLNTSTFSASPFSEITIPISNRSDAKTKYSIVFHDQTNKLNIEVPAIYVKGSSLLKSMMPPLPVSSNGLSLKSDIKQIKNTGKQGQIKGASASFIYSIPSIVRPGAYTQAYSLISNQVGFNTPKSLPFGFNTEQLILSDLFAKSLIEKLLGHEVKEPPFQTTLSKAGDTKTIRQLLKGNILLAMNNGYSTSDADTSFSSDTLSDPSAWLEEINQSLANAKASIKGFTDKIKSTSQWLSLGAATVGVVVGLEVAPIVILAGAVYTGANALGTLGALVCDTAMVLGNSSESPTDEQRLSFIDTIKAYGTDTLAPAFGTLFNNKLTSGDALLPGDENALSLAFGALDNATGLSQKIVNTVADLTIGGSGNQSIQEIDDRILKRRSTEIIESLNNQIENNQFEDFNIDNAAAILPPEAISNNPGNNVPGNNDPGNNSAEQIKAQACAQIDSYLQAACGISFSNVTSSMINDPAMCPIVKCAGGVIGMHSDLAYTCTGYDFSQLSTNTFDCSNTSNNGSSGGGASGGGSSGGGSSGGGGTSGGGSSGGGTPSDDYSVYCRGLPKGYPILGPGDTGIAGYCP